MSKSNRRDFLKKVGAVGLFYAFNKIAVDYKNVGVPVLRQSTKVQYKDPVHGANFGMMIDVGACIGCRRCQHACVLENNIPSEPSNMHWIDVYEMENSSPITAVESIPPTNAVIDYENSPKDDHWYLSFNCFHCENAPCTRVCPTGATYTDEDGIVLINYDLCIGCRYCMAACPYNARRFNWWDPKHPPSRMSPVDGSVVVLNEEVPLRVRGVTEKCTFCVHRVRAGKNPKCVEVCPVSARHFGDLNDPDSEVSRLLSTEHTIRIRENLGTRPKLHYFTRGVKWNEEGEKS
ncbi:4Fe-4S dicluster domain-containing protein [Candidatus Bathyarchaeota archaeon]|nr:4Fe-4S dicluster domain-containing protein [Candidatus Bathyarchaeota archaeon]